MSTGRHTRRDPVTRQRRGRRRLASPILLAVVGFALATTGAAYGFWTTGANGPGQAQAITLSTPGAGNTSSPTTTSLQINWGAASGLPAAGGYQVLRGTMNGGPYAPITSGTCAQTMTVTSSAISCVDNDSVLAPGTTYYYEVESVYYDVSTLWTSGLTAQFSGTTAQGAPTVSTSANPSSVTVGGSVDDQATFSGLVNPTTGTITWKLYAASDATCTGTVYFTSAPQSVTANATYTSSSFTTTSVGSFKWGFSYTGDTGNAAQSGCGGTNEGLSVTQATPTLGTSASTNVAVGQSVTDSATLAGGYNPTGTITYTLYGPSLTMSCATQVGQVTANVTSGNTTYTSPNITPTQAGTYWWIANYGGDTNNAATTNTCGGSGESSVVNRVTPTIVTTAKPSSVTVGGSVADQAVLSGGHSPTGTITWSLYSNASCTGMPVFTTSTGGAVSGNSIYTSTSFTTTTPGTYTWSFSYTGDTNNTPVSACGGTSETLTVLPCPPRVTTSADPAATIVGGSVADQATFSGLVNPTTGTITWKLYAASDTNCTGTVSFTSSAQKVTANTTYTSSSFTTTSTGTYKWGFSYTGDAHNGPVTGCGGSGESLTVKPATPKISTSAKPATTTVEGSVADQATFSGLYNPASSTGTITWKLYASSDTNCTGTVYFTSSTQSVTANTTYTSNSYTTLSAGTYTWAFSYSGDKNNNPVSACGGSGETLTVSGSGSLTLKPSTLPAATVGQSYCGFDITASGGKAPYTYAISVGSLPPGLSLNPSTGAITGTPTAGGTFTFTVRATDSAGPPHTTGSQTYALDREPTDDHAQSVHVAERNRGHPLRHPHHQRLEWNESLHLRLERDPAPRADALVRRCALGHTDDSRAVQLHDQGHGHLDRHRPLHRVTELQRHHQTRHHQPRSEHHKHQLRLVQRRDGGQLQRDHDGHSDSDALQCQLRHLLQVCAAYRRHLHRQRQRDRDHRQHDCFSGGHNDLLPQRRQRGESQCHPEVHTHHRHRR